MSVDVKLINGDLPEVTELVRGIELVAQRVRRRLQTQLGEWILDRFLGLPLIEWDTTRGIDPSEVARTIQLDLAQIPGVVRTSTFTGSIDLQTRIVRIEGELYVDPEVADEAITLALSSRFSDETHNAQPFSVSLAARAINGGTAAPTRSL